MQRLAGNVVDRRQRRVERTERIRRTDRVTVPIAEPALVHLETSRKHLLEQPEVAQDPQRIGVLNDADANRGMLLADLDEIDIDALPGEGNSGSQAADAAAHDQDLAQEFVRHVEELREMRRGNVRVRCRQRKP